MTREEEIKKAEVEYFNETYFDGCDYVGEVAKTAAFIAGAKWADEHPKEGMVSIDKACAWLNDTMDYLDCGDYDRLTHYADTIEEMIDDFRKAMEE